MLSIIFTANSNYLKSPQNRAAFSYEIEIKNEKKEEGPSPQNTFSLKNKKIQSLLDMHSQEHQNRKSRIPLFYFVHERKANEEKKKKKER